MWLFVVVVYFFVFDTGEIYYQRGISWKGIANASF